VAAEDYLFQPSYKSGLVARAHDGYLSIYRRAIGTFHDQRAVGIKVDSSDFREAYLPPGRWFCDLRHTAGCNPNSVARWIPLVLVA